MRTEKPEIKEREKVRSNYEYYSLTDIASDFSHTEKWAVLK